MTPVGRRRALAAAGLSLAAAACAGVGRGGTPPPRALLDRAIEQAGGGAALERARALFWEADAVVHAGGDTIRIAGRWSVQPPDTAVATTWLAARGPSTARSLVVAAPHGWTVVGGTRVPMSAPMLANERAQFYLYDVLRLVSLRASDVTLTAIPPDSLGQPGVRAARAGRPTVDLHVDATGRLAHVRLGVPDAESGAPVQEDVWLAGVIEADGVRWPRELRLVLGGAPYFDLRLRTLRILPRVADSLLARPP